MSIYENACVVDFNELEETSMLPFKDTANVVTITEIIISNYNLVLNLPGFYRFLYKLQERTRVPNGFG